MESVASKPAKLPWAINLSRNNFRGRITARIIKPPRNKTLSIKAKVSGYEMIPTISQMVLDRIQEGMARRILRIAHTLMKKTILSMVNQVSLREGNLDLKVAKAFQPLLQHFLVLIAHRWWRLAAAHFNVLADRQERHIPVRWIGKVSQALI